MSGQNETDGGLILRLQELLLGEPQGDPNWTANLAPFCAAALGGHDVVSHMVAPRESFGPGTVGHEYSQRYEMVTPETYVALIGQRLTELVELGVDEAFLVRSVATS